MRSLAARRPYVLGDREARYLLVIGGICTHRGNTGRVRAHADPRVETGLSWSTDVGGRSTTAETATVATRPAFVAASSQALLSWRPTRSSATDQRLSRRPAYCGERFWISVSATAAADCHGAVAAVDVVVLTIRPCAGEKKAVVFRRWP